VAESAGLPKGKIVSISNTSAAAPIALPEAAVSSSSHRTPAKLVTKPSSASETHQPRPTPAGIEIAVESAS